MPYRHGVLIVARNILKQIENQRNLTTIYYLAKATLLQNVLI